MLEKAKGFAQSDEPVLILGETGVGKDVFASFIHNEGPRWNEGFCIIHIPSLQNVAAELFGYAKGAFTDAKRDQRGKFEIYDGGTILLVVSA